MRRGLIFKSVSTSTFSPRFVSWLTVEEGYALKDGGRFFSIAPFFYGAARLATRYRLDGTVQL